MNVKLCFLGNIKKINNDVFIFIIIIIIIFFFFFFLSSAELAQIVVIRYPRAPSVITYNWFLIKKTLPKMSVRAYDNIIDKCHFEDYFRRC